ncbi:hypothetical protein FLA105535_04157 [Flavobacterium bizetiae]|nr:hypothetical protein FLA105535_04157 [Flavobacterium bizetiae]CAD5350263.1 hypothetical protein FLA105534_04253 [Flavobacterium bizetiae]
MLTETFYTLFYKTKWISREIDISLLSMNV